MYAVYTLYIVSARTGRVYLFRRYTCKNTVQHFLPSFMELLIERVPIPVYVRLPAPYGRSRLHVFLITEEIQFVCYRATSLRFAFPPYATVVKREHREWRRFGLSYELQQLFL